MLSLPSMWNMIISTVVFFMAVWYLRRYLDEQGIPKGATRGILVLTLASLVAWGAGGAVNWIQEKLQGQKPAAHAVDDAAQSPNSVDQLQR